MWRGRPRPRLSLKNAAEFFAVLVSALVLMSLIHTPSIFIGHIEPKSTVFGLGIGGWGARLRPACPPSSSRSINITVAFLISKSRTPLRSSHSAPLLSPDTSLPEYSPLRPSEL